MRRVAAAATATALQWVFYWLILHEAIKPVALPRSATFEVTLFSAARRLPRVVFPGKHQGRIGPHIASLAPQKASVAQPVTRPQPRQSPRHQIDWQQTIQSEVRAQEAPSLHQKLNFGFPQLPAIEPAAPAFGWDHAATDRVQALPGGGTLINLNDHCVLVIYVLLIPGCRIGTLPANGDLFAHMRDPTRHMLGQLP